MNLISVASYPSMKKNDRESYFNKLKKNSRFNISNDDGKILSTAELADQLAKGLL